MGFLKGKSALMISDNHSNLKYKYGAKNFLVERLLCGHSIILSRSKVFYYGNIDIQLKPYTKNTMWKIAIIFYLIKLSNKFDYDDVVLNNKLTNDIMKFSKKY